MKHRIVFLHNVMEAPEFSVYVNDELIRKGANSKVTKINFGEIFEFKIKHTKLDFKIRVGDYLVFEQSVKLEGHHSHKHYTIALCGNYLLKGSLGLFPISSHIGRNGFVEARFFHGLLGAPNVDVYIDGKIAIRNLQYGSHSQFVNIVPKTKIFVSLAVAETEQLIYTSGKDIPLELASGKNYDFVITDTFFSSRGIVPNEPIIRGIVY